MKNLTYRVQFIILAIWVPVVIGLFKVIPDRQMAALIAGAGFVFWPALFLSRELIRRNREIISWTHVFGCAQFLIFAALPIFLLRVLNWNREFNDLEILGVNAGELHRVSNISYLAMVIAVIFAHYRNRVKTDDED